MVSKKIVLCLFLSLFSAASAAELIEFKQTGVAQIKGFVGIGCGAGVMTGVHFTSNIPRALCAPLPVDATSIVQISVQTNGMYACPPNLAILLVSPDAPFITCGKLQGNSINSDLAAAGFIDYRNDTPACPSGQLVTAISFQNGLAVCNTLVE